MNIQHHPSDELLTAYAAGTLDQGQHIALATHLMTCSDCRKWVRSMEHLGGAVLTDLAPEAMSSGALDRILSRLEEPVEKAQIEPALDDGVSDVAGLPAFVRRFPAGEWKWLAPRLHLRRIRISESDETRVFLLKAGENLKLLPHAHTGVEMTCVLHGSFSHDGERYGVGDFDLGDREMNHDITIGPDGDCVCLVAMQGELQLKGFLGRLMQPFAAL